MTLNSLFTQPSYNLEDLKGYITTEHYLLFVVIHCALIIASIVILVKRKKGINTNSFFYKLGLKISNLLDIIYWRPLNYLHEKIILKIPGSGYFFEYIEPFLNTPSSVHTIIISLNILPKIIPALTFLIEVVIYGRIHYFIYSLFLLILTILFSIFLKTFSSFSELNIPRVLDMFLSLDGIGEKGADGVYDSYEVILKTEFEDQDPDQLIEAYICFLHVKNIVDFAKDILEWITPYITILTSIIYFVGGLVRLWLLL